MPIDRPTVWNPGLATPNEHNLKHGLILVRDIVGSVIKHKEINKQILKENVWKIDNDGIKTIHRQDNSPTRFLRQFTDGFWDNSPTFFVHI